VKFSFLGLWGPWSPVSNCNASYVDIKTKEYINGCNTLESQPSEGSLYIPTMVYEWKGVHDVMLLCSLSKSKTSFGLWETEEMQGGLAWNSILGGIFLKAKWPVSCGIIFVEFKPWYCGSVILLKFLYSFKLICFDIFRLF
jgi:hypothetical protein